MFRGVREVPQGSGSMRRARWDACGMAPRHASRRPPSPRRDETRHTSRHARSVVRFLRHARRDLVARFLARLSLPAAAAVSRRGRARARARRTRDAAAPRDELRDRVAQDRDRRGRARRALHPLGRRLRRELRGLPFGGDRGETQDPPPDEPRPRPRDAEADRPDRPLRRAVREAAQHAHRDPRRRRTAEFPRRQREPPRVHARGADARSGAPPARLRAQRAHAQLRPGADRRRLRRPPSSRELGSRLRAPLAARRRVPAHGRLDRREPALHGDPRRRHRRRDAADRLLHEPRAPRPRLRGGAHAAGPAARGLVQPLDAPPVDRDAHRRSARRAPRVLPRDPQSDRREGRAGRDARGAPRDDPHARSGGRAGARRPRHAVRRAPGRARAAATRPRGARFGAAGRLDLRPDARGTPRRSCRPRANGRESP